MKNKKNFRIKRSVKMDEIAAKNSLLQKALQRIIGGRTNTVAGLYNRLAGIIEENQPV